MPGARTITMHTSVQREGGLSSKIGRSLSKDFTGQQMWMGHKVLWRCPHEIRKQWMEQDNKHETVLLLITKWSWRPTIGSWAVNEFKNETLCLNWTTTSKGRWLQHQSFTHTRRLAYSQRSIKKQIYLVNEYRRSRPSWPHLRQVVDALF